MRTFLFLCGVLCFTSCKKHGSSSKTASEVIASRYLKVKEPGVGYSTLLGNFVSDACVDGQAQYREIYPHNIASFEAGHSEDRGLSTDKVAWGGTAETKYGMFSVTGDIEVEASLVEEDLKTSVYTSFSLDAGTLFLKRYELSAFGQGVLSKTPEERFLDCGDEFIHQINLGARVYVGLEYSFASSLVKTAFSAALKGSASIAGKKVEKTLWDEKISAVPLDKVKGSVNIVFEQEGGDYNAFLAFKQNVIPTNCYVGSVKTTEAAIDLGEGSSPCIAAYKKIIDEYVREEFPKQLRGLADAKNGLPQSGLVPLKYYTLPYRSIGYPQLSKPVLKIPDELKNLRDVDINELSQLFMKLTARLRVFRNILENTANNSVLDDVKNDAKSLLKAINIDSAERYVAEQRLIKSEYDRVSNLCGNLLVAGLKQAVKDGNTAAVQPQIAECKSEIAEVKNKISKLLKLI